MNTVIGARPPQDDMTIGYGTTGKLIMHPSGVVQTMEGADLVAIRVSLETQKMRIENQIAALDTEIVILTRLESDLTAEDITELMESFVPWATDEVVTVGMLRKHTGMLYKCLQEHTTQADWTPDTVPALWLHVVPDGVIPDFVQPTGAHDAYQTGDQVVFVCGLWESLIDANVWSPTAYSAGWNRIGDA